MNYLDDTERAVASAESALKQGCPIAALYWIALGIIILEEGTRANLLAICN